MHHVHLSGFSVFGVFLLLIPIQENGAKEEGGGGGGGGQGRGHLTSLLKVKQTQSLLPWGWGRTMMTPS